MICVDGVELRAGDFQLGAVSFEVSTGAYGILMGKTGSGKTSLLEAIAGLKSITAGRILLDGIDVTRLKPAERNIGYVPQDAALFSTMTVEQNLAFALVVRGLRRREIAGRVRELAQLLDIQPLLNRTVQGLSGGEQQRVALGRALAFRPSTLCLDEPLSALDDDTREQMYRLLEHVRRRTNVTTLHVTHNLDEAMRLGDTIIRIEDGRTFQKRPPPGSVGRPGSEKRGGAPSVRPGGPDPEIQENRASGAAKPR